MRHADVEYSDSAGRPVHPDHVTLTPRGLEQARAAARLLAAVPLDAVITSDLPRTIESADAVLAGRELPRRVDPGWREIQTGKVGPGGAFDPVAVRAAILAALPGDLSADHCFLGGESFGRLLERARGAWQAALDEPGWRHLLIVSHGLIIRTLLCWMLGAPLGAVGKIEQDACCVNLIDVAADGTPLVRLVNFTPANPLKLGMTLSTLEGLAAQFLQGRRTS
jgi:probable phosphoglycerate mutase